MREMAIRQALGAQPRDVIGHVLRQGITMIVAGIVVGVAGSLALSRVLSRFLYEVRANDPSTLSSAVALLSIVALAACWIPRVVLRGSTHWCCCDTNRRAGPARHPARR